MSDINDAIRAGIAKTNAGSLVSMVTATLMQKWISRLFPHPQEQTTYTELVAFSGSVFCYYMMQLLDRDARITAHAFIDIIFDAADRTQEFEKSPEAEQPVPPFAVGQNVIVTKGPQAGMAFRVQKLCDEGHAVDFTGHHFPFDVLAPYGGDHTEGPSVGA